MEPSAYALGNSGGCRYYSLSPVVDASAGNAAPAAGFHKSDLAYLENVIVASQQSAILFRMVLPDHTCPFRVRAKELLEAAGFAVDDRILSSREETDAFEAEQNVDTTPQVFINDERIGGCEAPEAWLTC